jgi:ABC-type amino acid transport substrate-binding protein
MEVSEMTKRILSVLLAAVLIALSCAACGGRTVKAVKSPDDFPNAKIAVQTDTTSADILDDLIAEGKLKEKDISRYEKVTQCMDDLKLGRVDCVFLDSVVAAYYMVGNNDFNRAWIDDEPEPMGICMRKESAGLAAAVEAAIDTLYYNGTIAELAKKHFGEDLSANLRTVTAQPVIPDFDRNSLFAAGTLTVGAEVGYPPMEYTTEDGLTFIGYDIDVGKAIADLLGLEHNVINTSWDGIFAGLEKAQYDCIISAVSITPARLEKYILTSPYVMNQQCIVVKK